MSLNDVDILKHSGLGHAAQQLPANPSQTQHNVGPVVYLPASYIPTAL